MTNIYFPEIKIGDKIIKKYPSGEWIKGTVDLIEEQGMELKDYIHSSWISGAPTCIISANRHDNIELLEECVVELI